MKAKTIHFVVAAVSLLLVGAGISLTLAKDAAGPSGSETSGASTSTAPVVVTAGTAKPLLLAGQSTVTYVKIGLTGAAAVEATPRPLLNVALVLDRSSSMSGEKLARAREAAQMAVRGMRDEDIVSVVTYSASAEVVVPATKATSRDQLCETIAGISSSGNTALFAGVTKGAAELRKFASKERVNRLILLSDGQANSGPSTPAELGDLGVSLGREGISVTTVGLGDDYNEDLMTKLATTSDGRHAFIAKNEDLAPFFKEEMNLLGTVAAQRASVEVVFDPGIRPLRALGREVAIAGQKAAVTFNQLYAQEEKYLLFEVEVPATNAGVSRDLARISVTYENPTTKAQASSTATVSVRFTDSAAEVEAKIDRDVMIAAVEQVAVENSREAVALRDAGKIAEAKNILFSNDALLRENAIKLNAPKLQSQAEWNAADGKKLDGKDWKSGRKQMRDYQQNVGVRQGKATDEVSKRR